MADDKSELLMFYQREIKFQSDLLSSRLSSLLTSQSFLLIAYASAMSGLVGPGPLSPAIRPLSPSCRGAAVPAHAQAASPRIPSTRKS
jgi:hypothetical protein